MGMAAFMKTESRKETGECEGVFQHVISGNKQYEAEKILLFLLLLYTGCASVIISHSYSDTYPCSSQCYLCQVRSETLRRPKSFY